MIAKKWLAVLLFVCCLTAILLFHEDDGFAQAKERQIGDYKKEVAEGKIAQKTYAFTNDPIDAVIVAHPKDRETLDLCIHGIKTNCNQIRRVIVVSAEPLTESAEWFDEAKYPFSKATVALHLLKSPEEAEKYLAEPKSYAGWYYQQLLKLYALFVIPNLSPNILLLDSDTVFLNPVEFMDPSTFAGLYDPSFQHHDPYFEHAERLVPNFKKIYPDYSGIANHLLIQRCVLEDLFGYVESHHEKPFWEAFCDLVDPNQVMGAGASEYEIYFNFVFARTDQVKVRAFCWNISEDLSTMPYFQENGYHYITYHEHMRLR